MIKQINKIKNFGIFQDYKSGSINPFSKYNLIYGWNGCGKTTLSRLLRCFELNQLHEDFKNAEFEIELNDANKINHSFNKNINIRVFNTDFVEKNIHLFKDASKTEPIIYISKEKIEEKEKLEKISQLRVQKIILKESKEKERDNLQKVIDDFHTDAGRNIKNFFLGTIHANVTYNKNTSERIWQHIKEKVTELNEIELSDSELSRYKSYTLVDSRKELINYSFSSFSLDKIKGLEKEINNVLSANVASKIIDRLKDNPDINKWVQDGLLLHNSHKSMKCEFCGQKLPDGRLSEIEAHFNDEYTKVQSEISLMIQQLQNIIILPLLSIVGAFYDEFKDNYFINLNFANIKLEEATKIIKAWIALLEKKKANPFEWPGSLSTDIQPFTLYNHYVGEIESIVKKHNKISNDHAIHANEAKTKIEEHFVVKNAIIVDLRKKEDNLKILKDEIEKISHKDIIDLDSEINKLELALRNDSIAINDINDNLHRFLGRNNISLQRIKEGGYQILRNGSNGNNLCEGEKSAIALMYFTAKLVENNNDIKSTIVVFDDPVSSFDSNHLFNACTFIVSQCIDAEQLFILTHNFWFFKQIRDWMHRINKKEKKQIGSLYFIDGNCMISNATEALIKYHSEYHFVFSRILKYKDSPMLLTDDYFNLANSARRVLEAFTSFKTPNDSGVNGAIALAVKKGFSQDKKERIYYFLNKYTHLDRIEGFDNTIENVMHEGYNVIQDILDLIKLVDEDHFNSMIDVCKKEELVN